MTHMEKNRDFTILALSLSAWNDWPPTRHVYWHWYWGPLLKFVITHSMMMMLPLFLWWLWLYKYARAVSLAGLALFPLTEFSCLFNYEKLWKVMLLWRYVMQAVDPEAEFFPSLLLVHNEWLVFNFVEECETANSYWVFAHKNELLSEFAGSYWLFVVKILWTWTCVIEWENHGIMGEILVWTTSCCLEGLSPQLITCAGKKLTYSRKLMNFSESHSTS